MEEFLTRFGAVGLGILLLIITLVVIAIVLIELVDFLIVDPIKRAQSKPAEPATEED